MTRYLGSLTAVLLLCGAVATAPQPVAEAAVVPVRHAVPTGSALDVRVGDGIFRIRIRGCETCRTILTFELQLPSLLDALQFRLPRTVPEAPGQPAVNHLPPVS